MAEIYNPQDDPVERRAAFAQSFRGTTNLDQRRRFAQDLSEAKARQEERDEALFEERQRQDPRLMQAVTARGRERRLANEAMDKADLAERKFTWDQEKASLSRGLQERSILLREKQERRLFQQAQDDLDTAFRMEEDTYLFRQAEKGLRERGVMPGTKAYRDGLAQIVVDHPYVDPKYRDPIMKGAGITDPDDIQKQMAALREKVPNGRITLGEDGIPRIVEAPVTPPKPAELPRVDLRRKDSLIKDQAELEAEKKLSPAKQKRLDYIRGEIKGIEEQQRAAAKAATPSTPAAQAATAQPKAITVDDARNILKEVGGDKEKARALARERGYQF